MNFRKQGPGANDGKNVEPERGVSPRLRHAVEQALAAYHRGDLIKAEILCRVALKVENDSFEALNLLAVVQSRLGSPNQALATFARALSLRPDNADALNNMGNTFLALKRFAEALSCYERALVITPDSPSLLTNRGNALQELKRLEEAVASYERAIAIKPDQNHALGGLASCVLMLCDWTRRGRVANQVCQHVRQNKTAISPFWLFGYTADPALQLACAKHYLRDQLGAPRQAQWRGERWRNDKIKVAYVSADFCRHPTSYLAAELFELHDRSRFEIIGVSFGPNDGSDIRARVAAGFDQFIDMRDKSDEEVAWSLHRMHVDIAVDLMGHTRGCRLGIFAARPAPIQVNYLGFPATNGAVFFDYIIADPIALPLDQQPFYVEKIVHLPDCYQVNDRKRSVAENTPSRQELGLPGVGFVFCCFNNTWKITPDVFDVWMRLLRKVEGSVLWLLGDNTGAANNLRREAASRGIDPQRLVFAERMAVEDHIARHRAADLLLDTLPYNAHTTASDALWAGLPVLTCQGNSFPGRVAASLLHAIGLPELITADLLQYEARALELAQDPRRLADIKTRLIHNRSSFPLFDSDKFCHNIEAAYTQMWESWQRGGAPVNIQQ
jgi:protein O-GlcNAc transferase